MFKLIGIFIVLFISFNISAQDSIASHELKELEVKGKKTWVADDGRVIVIPSKSEKRLSDSPGGLIKQLHLPMLKGEGSSITTVDGQAVAIFINGLPAEESDLAVFWPMDVRRVEYMVDPTDPVYLGARRAVNFIMAKYVVGGVSKAGMAYTSPDYENASISSKLEYKKMTFGLLLFGWHSKNSLKKVSGTETYTDIYYKGEKYDEISRMMQERGNEDRNYQDFAFNAKYTGKKITATHTVGLNRRHTPRGWTDDKGVWSRDLFGAEEISSTTSSRSLTPQISGSYYLTLSDNVVIPAKWSYRYGYNKNNSTSSFGLESPVLNSTAEHVHTLGVTVAPYYRPLPVLSFQLIARVSADWFNTKYKGSVETVRDQSRQDMSASLRTAWQARQNIVLIFQPGIQVNTWKIGDVNGHTLKPSAEASINWRVSSQYSLNGSFGYSTTSPGAAESNPVRVQSNELEWISGNPYLKPQYLWNLYLSNLYLVNNWLNMSLSLAYERVGNDIQTVYTAASKEYGGIFKELINGQPTDWLRLNYSVSASLFDDKMNIGVNPRWTYQKQRGTYGRSLSYLSVQGEISYTAGDFDFEVWYEPKSKSLDFGGMEWTRSQDRFSLSATYGNGNLHVTARCEDIFHKYNKTSRQFISGHYYENSDELIRGRTFKISVSYTFGYGKKVSSDINIDSPTESKSNVLK